jgi:molybdopterin molybdotransferase
LVLAKGQLLNAAEIGLLATLGKTRLSVFKEPVIGLLSSGNELVSPFSKEEVPVGKIRNSNSAML